MATAAPAIVSRSEAKALKLSKYFTGKPCVNGHIAAHRTECGGCAECGRLDAIARSRLPETKNNRVRTRPHYAVQERESSRAWYAKKDGHTPPPLERDCPPRPVDGRCDCCLKIILGDKPGRFHLDHDHVTGAFRGWVCVGCNAGAHGVMDNQDWLRTRADFLDVKLPWQ
jgi:hypothetical protein